MKIYSVEIPGFGFILMKAKSSKEVANYMKEMKLDFEDKGKIFKPDLSSIRKVKFKGKVNLIIMRLNPKPLK